MKRFLARTCYRTIRYLGEPSKIEVYHADEGGTGRQKLVTYPDDPDVTVEGYVVNFQLNEETEIREPYGLEGRGAMAFATLNGDILDKDKVVEIERNGVPVLAANRRRWVIDRVEPYPGWNLARFEREGVRS